MKKEDPAGDFRAADEALNAADFEAAMLRAEKSRHPSLTQSWPTVRTTQRLLTYVGIVY